MRKALLLIVVALLAPLTPAVAVVPPGTTAEVSVTPSGHPGSGSPDFCQSFLACGASVDISSNGRFVAFATPFTDILPADTNDEIDVFVRDLDLGVTELVSIAKDGGWADAGSAFPSISDDGRFVAFMSAATNLTDIDGEGNDVFVRDRLTGTTTIESYGPDGQLAGFQGVDDAVLSGNGRYLIFQSGGFQDDRTNDPLLPFGGINFANVYRRDLVEGRTEMVSLTHDGQQSLSVDISLDNNAVNSDGTVIAFGSQRHDLVPRDSNAQTDIFVADLNENSLERVSVATDGTQANWISYGMALSADGRYVSFSSAANNLVPVDTTSSRVPGVAIMGGAAAPDVFVHDRETGITERVSVTSQGLEPGDAFFNDISDDGRYVAFSAPSGAYDGRTDYEERIWIHDRVTGQTDLVSRTSAGGDITAAFGSTISLSGDGSTVAFAGVNSTSPSSDAAFIHRRSNSAAPEHVSVTEGASQTRVQGQLRLPGVVLGTVEATGETTLGPSLTGLTVIYRPELGDVLLRIPMSGLPKLGLPVPAGPYLGPGRRPMAPPGFSITLDGDAGRRVITPTLDEQGDGSFATDAGELISGSVGVVGDEAWVAIPGGVLSSIGSVVTVNARTGVGGTTEATLHIQIPTVEVTVGDGTRSADALVTLSERSIFDATLSGPATGDPIWVTVCIVACTTTQI